MKKCKGGCQMRAGGKTCMKCGCDMEDEEYEKGEKEMRSGGMACMKCGGKMHKSGGTVSSCMKCGGGKYTFGGKVGWSKKKINNQYASGGMIKRADGSYSQRGLWDNIRDNAGSGKKPTKQMLEQEKKIKQEMAVGGMVDTGCPPGFVKDFFTGKCVPAATTQDSTDVYNSSINLQNKMLSLGYIPDNDNWTIREKSFYNSASDISPQELLAEKTYLNPNQKLTDVPLLGTAAHKYNNINKQKYVKDIGDFYVNKKIDENKYEVSELSSTVGYNTDLPYQLFDRRIAPTSYKGYDYSPKEKGALGDTALMLSYDPVAVKPYKDRTPEEHIEYQQKYGNYGGAAESYVPNAITIPDPGKPKQEPDYYSSMKMTKYSPEDILSLYNLKGYGLEHPNMQYLDLDFDLNEKLRRYKNKEKFTPMNIMVEGYQFTPSPEELDKMNQDNTYKRQWANEQMEWRYGKDWRNKLGKKSNYQPSMRSQSPYTAYSFGGAVKGLKKYSPGGEIDNTLMTNDPEIQISKGAFNVSEPAYDANKIISRVFDNALSIKESEQPTTKQTGYKEDVKKNKVVKDDKSLPNWGRAKKEQQILNELIRKDIAAGKAKMDLLVEDDIIGDYTLGAMRAYEASGQYTRPELFKDKWLAEYKKQWDEMQKSKSSASNQESKTESSWVEKMFGFKKSELVNQPEAKKQNATKSTGWSKEQLLKEGGVEIDSKELTPKDFDTYQPIKGITKSTKGVRATGRDISDAYFDAVEKGQYFDLNGLKANTSLKLIGDLLSKSKKAIVIPKGQDPYGRDLNDIYLQDENDPSKYHALDSLGVVNREAIFGKYIGEESKMTDRQKMITGQAKEKGGFKYSMSPYIFRKLNSQESPKQTTTKSKEEPLFKSSYLKSLSNMVSGLKSGISGAIEYTGNALGDFIETASEFAEKYQDKKEVPNYIKNAKGEVVSSDLNKRLKEKSIANKAKEDAESKKRIEYLKSDLSSGYNSAKQLGSDAMTGIGNAFKYAINLAKTGEELKQQESAKNNFGKRSASAAAEAMQKYSKKSLFSEGYTPFIFPSTQPMEIMPNKENLPITTQESQTPETFTSIKDFLYANKTEDKKKLVAEATAKNEYKKRINEEAKTIMKLDLKTPKTKDDIKYNYSAIDNKLEKIEKALNMLSGASVTTDKRFNEMTTKRDWNNVTIKRQQYANIPGSKEYGTMQSVDDKEYDKLVVIKTYLDKELDKIYKDPRYKDLDETAKKAVLTRALFNKRKELASKQEAMKKQLK